MWRSPEAHASAEVHTPSDMFSFGLMVRLSSRFDGLRSEVLQCIYAITKRMVLAVNEEKNSKGIELLDVVLERQFSYFSDLEGIDGLIRYPGDSPWAQLIAMVAADFNADNPRRPLASW